MELRLLSLDSHAVLEGERRMRKFLLLKTQKNEVLEVIEKFGLNPSEFEWREIEKDPVYYAADAGIISALAHVSTEYKFEFDMRGDTIWATFSPGEESPIGNRECRNWAEMLILVIEWIRNLKREIESPDLWAMIGEETKIVEVAGAAKTDQSFTPEQQQEIHRAMAQIKRFLVEDHQYQDEQMQFISERLEYLELAAKRMSVKDWLHTAIGVLFTIVIGLGLEPDRARELFSFAGNALSQLLGKFLP